jgi:hypothetical protein
MGIAVGGCAVKLPCSYQRKEDRPKESEAFYMYTNSPRLYIYWQVDDRVGV